MVWLECSGMVRLPSGGRNRMQSVVGGADRGLGLSVTVAAMPDVIGQRLGHVADKLASREHGDGFHVAVVLSVDVAHQVVPNPPLPVVAGTAARVARDFVAAGSFSLASRVPNEPTAVPQSDLKTPPT